MSVRPELISRKETLHYDVVVVGGGLAGVCAAIAAARGGARTALLQNRSMLGGNASSEIRMHICGANCQLAKKNVNETGILMELILENKRLNPNFNFHIWDTVLMNAVWQTEGLELYLNTNCMDAEVQDDRILSVSCYQSSTERHLTFTAELFVDSTGHGTLGYFAGAEYRMGSEGKAEFGEIDAEEEENCNLMGNTLLFKAVDRGRPVAFTKPEWAYTFTEEQLKKRIHTSFNGVLNGDQLIAAGEKGATGLPEMYCVDYGYWWIELGGDSGDIIGKSEELRDELMRSLWGIWDHIKNGGEHGAENYDLQWCGIIPGSRDSRRLVGDYLLNEKDILANRVFPDAVAYGGWAMDVHRPGGLKDTEHTPSRVIPFEGVYTIPYRSYYSVNIRNLMMAGRIISATKMGMSSSRVMATCAVGGQAVGAAAALCIKHACSPRELGATHITELQEALRRDDCWLPGLESTDPADLAHSASVTAVSERAGYSAAQVTNGRTRSDAEGSNAWHSEGLADGNATLQLQWDRPQALQELRLVFDPDLSCEMVISLSGKKQAQQIPTLPPVLVKDYTVTLKKGDETVLTLPVKNNARRLAVHRFDPIEADRVILTVEQTHGAEDAAVFEISAFGTKNA